MRANKIPSGLSEIWNSTAQNKMGKTITNAKGTTLLISTNTPVATSTIPIMGKKSLVLAMAPKKAPASGPTSGMGANWINPFSPKNNKNMPKIILMNLVFVFISNVLRIIHYKIGIAGGFILVMLGDKMVLFYTMEVVSKFFGCDSRLFFKELSEI